MKTGDSGGELATGKLKVQRYITDVADEAFIYFVYLLNAA